MIWLRMLVRILLLLGLLWLAGRLIFPVPGNENRPEEVAMPFDPATTFGAQAADAQESHAGQSGVIPLPSGIGALHSRIALAEEAGQSIDIMYYIWHQDESGMLLMGALRDAAERGVRVRLLLDDNGIHGLDPILAALNNLPNFSIRIFNPSTVRKPKMLGYLLSPLRMNRRMHNKAFIVDGAVTIVGGRNIGNEYFSVGDQPAYLDLDVLGVGQVVDDTARVFDQYWNSKPVHALEQVISGTGDMVAFETAVAAARASEAAASFNDSVQTAIHMMAAGQVPAMEWTNVQLVADDPAKGTGEARRDQLMITRLGDILGGVQDRLDLISAYFVPGKAGNIFFSDLARNGVWVRIMTNSWQATDVPTVHAGYVKYRRELLESGVELYELKRSGNEAQGKAELGPLGASGASLHAKTFTVDNSRVFIGSFNFDPRSALLNCEMGFLIDSPSIAQASSAAMTDILGARSFQPVLQDGDMVWRDPQPDGTITVIKNEPDLGFFNRAMVYILNILPIEWLL